jgi:hypothetical protein
MPHKIGLGTACLHIRAGFYLVIGALMFPLLTPTSQRPFKTRGPKQVIAMLTKSVITVGIKGSCQVDLLPSGGLALNLTALGQHCPSTVTS